MFENFGTKNFVWGWKVLGLFAYAILTIATCVGVWNSHPDGWLIGVSVTLFLVNGYIVYRKVKKLLYEGSYVKNHNLTGGE